MGERYSYRKEGDEYVLYDGNTVVRNPNDKIISTENEELAAKLVEALEREEDYTNGKSLLRYHYIYCDIREIPIDRFRKKFSLSMTVGDFMGDYYLMFKQKAPVKEAYAKYYSNYFSSLIDSLNKYQLLAMLVMHCCFETWVLSLHIIQDIMEKISESKTYTELKTDFLEELEKYLKIEYADFFDYEIFDEEWCTGFLKDLSDTIDAFVYYYNVK